MLGISVIKIWRGTYFKNRRTYFKPLILNLFQKIDIEVHPDDIEACHWVTSNAGPKKVIIKMSRRKDADKIQRTKEKLKGLDLSPIGINSTVFINDSLCRYYKNLWAKCKKLWLNKFIHGF